METIDIVAKAFRDFAEGNEDAWHPLIDPDITLYDPIFLMPRQVVGAEAYHAYADELVEVYPDFSLDEIHYHEGKDGRVLMIATVSGTRADGERLLHRFGCIWTMRKGKFWNAIYYPNPEVAKAALGPVRRDLKDY